MDEKKDTYTIKQLHEKLIANSFLGNLKNPTNFFYYPEMAEKIAKGGGEKVRECEKALERYDELSKMALKYKCTIIVPTQPNSERNYIVPQEFKNNPDILVIDYFDKI